MWFLERGREAHEGGLDLAVLAREAPDDRTHLLAFGTGPRVRQHGGKSSRSSSWWCSYTTSRKNLTVCAATARRSNVR